MPSFSMRLESRKIAEWKPPPFPKPLDKSDRKKKLSDEMTFDISRFYISACSCMLRNLKGSIQYFYVNSAL
jgi:hypothetical protein